jgi:hypothetical protein
MKRFRKRPSPAMIVAMTALFISLVGTAFAGPIAEISLNKGEKKQIRKISRNISGKVSNRRITQRAPGLSVASAQNAVIANVANAANTATNAENAKDADSAKTADSADTVTDGAITTPKLADSAVTAGKLDAGERSQGFQTQSTGLLNTELGTGLLGNYGTATSVVSRTLPAGNYVVFAKTELINSSLEPRSVICRLFDDGVQRDEGSTPVAELIIVAQGTVSTMGISNGGTLHLRCLASGDDTFAFNRELVAIRVGSVN